MNANMNARRVEIDAPKGVWSDSPPAPSASAPPIPLAALKPSPVPRMDKPRFTVPRAPGKNGAAVSPDVACHVEPVAALDTTAPPPKAPSEPPVRVIRPSERPKALLNPWEGDSILPPPPQLPTAPETRGSGLRAGGIGFALGLAVAAAVAFAMWPRTHESLADVTEPDIEAAAAAMANDPSPREAELALAELDSPMVTQGEAFEVEPQLAVEPVVSPVVASPQVRARRTHSTVAVEEPASDDEPAMGSEPTVGPAPIPALALEPAADLPAAPTREDVSNAIQEISAQLRECAPEYPGYVANIRFTFVSSGRAAAALVPNDFAGPAERSCVARVARTAHVPAFSDPNLAVTYPVRF